MSSFRLICIAAFTAATAMFVAQTAAAQSSTAADRSGNPYLAGLPPPHEHHKPAQAKTSHAGAQRQPTVKTAQPATKRRPAITANAKLRRPARLAEKINSHVAWPSVEPATADESTTPPTALQFATDDAGQTPVAPPRPATATPTAAAKISPPARVSATAEHDGIDSASAQPATASTLVQTERIEPTASSQTRVILPAQSEAPITASIPNDQQPARGSSITAQLLTTLAGAISACIVGWLMFGFGPVRTFK